ncbi:MAG: 50S ribosomal protein L19 [Dehalococcoidia bacterium]|nr:50S ribosomal protein L19 [Dehalococcoidia bacterium]
MDIKTVTSTKMNPAIPRLAPGDTVKVTFKTVEGDKERTQHFQGVVIKIQKGVPAGSFTLRRSAYGIGVERTFFFLSPNITKVEVLRHGKVRRAKLYYLRRLSAREGRLKERQEAMAEKTLTEQAAQTASIAEATGGPATEATTVEATLPPGQISPSAEDSRH